MRRQLSVVVRKFGTIFHLLSRYIYKDPEPDYGKMSEKDRNMHIWADLEPPGDKTLRLEYSEMKSDSLVIDLGAYIGDWASDVFCRYDCKIWSFEPVNQYHLRSSERFEENDKVQVFNFGLGNSKKEEIIFINDIESSLYTEVGEPKKIQIHSFDTFMSSNNVKLIDLLKINIEGGEYDLLEYLIASDWISKIQNIQIQFHDFIPNAEERMIKIQDGLKCTHTLTYQYVFVWENWKLKK